MDERLVAIYGTGQTDAGDDQDLQKTAAAELLVKLAEQEGIDLDSLSDDQVTSLVQELYKSAGELPPFMQEKKDEGKKEESAESSGESSTPESKETKESKDEAKKEGAAKEEPSEQEKEAQAKFAEADFLGRAMAHAFVQEVGLIQKEAAAQQEPTEKQAGKMGNLANLMKGRAQAAGKAAAGAAKKPGVAAGAAGAAGLAAGAAAGRASKKKEASALDGFVDQKALELLKTAGYVDEAGNIMPPPAAQSEQQETTKQASVFDIEVTKLALQKLAGLGYPVKWD